MLKLAQGYLHHPQELKGILRKFQIKYFACITNECEVEKHLTLTKTTTKECKTSVKITVNGNTERFPRLN